MEKPKESFCYHCEHDKFQIVDNVLRCAYCGERNDGILLDNYNQLIKVIEEPGMNLLMLKEIIYKSIEKLEQ